MKILNYAASLKVTDKVYAQVVMRHFEEALLMDGADLTSSVVVDGGRVVRASLIAKDSGVLAGMEEVKFFLKGRGVRVMHGLRDGAVLKRGSVLCVLEGRAVEVLRLERTVLNFLQRMSGVATLASKYVRATSPRVLVCPTRKTLWGVLDKKACAVGGAGTHRLSLDDAVLVKDTHLDLIGHDFEKLRAKLLRVKSLGRFVEVEVESVMQGLKAVEILQEVRLARRVPCLVMLDNMKVADVRKFVGLVRGSGILVEASGGITFKNIAAYARAGADVISVGALTHSARALDISLKIM